MAESPDDKSSQQPNPWRMAHMGLEFAGAALLMGLIGYYIDLQAGTKPWFALSGLALGLVGGMYRFIKEALAVNRQYSERYRKEHPKQTDSTDATGDADPDQADADQADPDQADPNQAERPRHRPEDEPADDERP